MADLRSTYSVHVNRDLHVIGSVGDLAAIEKILSPLNFIHVKDARDVMTVRESLFFVVAILDFQSLRALQAISALFSRIDTMKGVRPHRVIFVSTSLPLSEQQLLFGVEIGAAFMAHGPSREEELRAHIKRISLEAGDRATATSLEKELELAHWRQDQAGMRALEKKIGDLPGDQESTWKLQAKLANAMLQPKKEEHYLKRILAVNSQNLWAANALGKLFLRQHRVAEGIEILRKMSVFHDLNAERHFEIGNAFLYSGKNLEARSAFQRADELASGSDTRFKDGLAKVELNEGNVDGALSVLNGRPFSYDVLSFLNMKAIMAIRSGKFGEGFTWYDRAMKGCDQSDQVMQARLHFNRGLGYTRSNEPDKAIKAFEESLKLGGNKFKRAAKPLEITKSQMLKIKKSGAPTNTPDHPEILEIDYETLD